MPLIVIHFARFGPYHLARIESARSVLAKNGWDIVGLETGGYDTTYDWREETGPTSWQRVAAFPGEAAEVIPARRLVRGMRRVLDELRPNAVAIAGWGSVDARACLDWCKRNGAKAIVMSETRALDGQRVWWKEKIKRYLISRFDGALVGGKSHRDYLVKLGMVAEKIQFGYNVVDNAYFAEECLKVRKSRVEGQEGQPYFLASNRFIERKNLSRLIDAYVLYTGRAMTAGRALESPECGMCSDTPILPHPTPLATSGPARRSSPTWNLCLLGDGELKADLIAQCHVLGLSVIESAPWESSLTSASCPTTSDSSFQISDFNVSAFSAPIVYFPGFRQIDELPKFYAHAGCFVHPALEEPWGLVLNEAMACGLPVLSGSNVGAAEELVDDGVNGRCFDAANVDEIAASLGRIAELSEDERLGFSAASARILEERCPTEAFGTGLAGLLVG